jgi:hypothetical protein
MGADWAYFPASAELYLNPEPGMAPRVTVRYDEATFDRTFTAEQKLSHDEVRCDDRQGWISCARITRAGARARRVEREREKGGRGDVQRSPERHGGAHVRSMPSWRVRRSKCSLRRCAVSEPSCSEATCA